MAQGPKGPAPPTMQNPSNGLLTSSSAPGAVGVNRKKQKRRAKQAARQAEQQAQQKPGVPLKNGHHVLESPASPVAPASGSSQYRPLHNGTLDHVHGHVHGHFHDHDPHDPHDPSYDEQYFTDDDGQAYGHQYSPVEANGLYPTTSGKKSKKKKKKAVKPAISGDVPISPVSHGLAAPPPPPPPPPSSNTLRSMQRSTSSKDKIWNTSTQEERENIKEFWLSLGEDERKSLVKIEKEAVLRKMKEQQKHSCSCTVCGRKRTAIEEELEVLYDAYYEELEQYANHQQPENGTPIPLPPSRAIRGTRGLYPPTPHSSISARNRFGEPEDDEDDEDDEEPDSEEYSDEEDDDDYSDDDVEEIPRGPAADFFNFGNSLTVKGGILTVADDLLKNDGKKFIEMMEQLAERRMARENEAQYRMNSAHPNSHHGHEPPDDDDYEDEEEDFDSNAEEYDDEEDEMDAMTEEQRMEEGRRMFQIFAARMFEQRVLTAYREKVARERQQKLLEELDDEDERDKARLEKKARDAAKKKEKKKQQQQAKAEEKARKDAEKAQQEKQAKEAEEKKLEEQKRKKEEQRKKRDAERKAQEEERHKKEAEKVRRAKEEKERQQEVERKAREHKQLERQAREEAKKKEREEREAKEKEIREKRAKEEKAKRDAKAKAEQDAKELRMRKEEQSTHVSQGPIHGPVRRPSQPPVALPPGLLSKQSSTGFPSPHVQVATPALPKAPTPNRPRQSSQQGSHGSSPKTPHVAPGAGKSMSPPSTIPPAQPVNPPKTILQKPPSQPTQPHPSAIHHAQPTSPLPPIGPPPGMHPAPGAGFGVPPGMNGFPPGQMPPLPGMGPRPPMGQHMPMFPQNPLNTQFRPFGPGSMPPPPPGMTGPPIMQHSQGMPLEAPPGFPASLPGMAPISQPTAFGREPVQSHSRQQSASYDKAAFEPAIGAPQGNPIQRPAPIQRPSSVKPGDGFEDKELEDLSRHLGSSALLDDADDIPAFDPDRRASAAAAGPRSARMQFGSGAILPPDPNAPRMDSFGLPSSGPGSAWSTPTLGGGFGSMSSAGGWGSSPTTGLPSGLFNNAFGGGVVGQNRFNVSRPQSIRLLACQACKQLFTTRAGADGFQDVGEVLQQVNRNLKVGEPQVLRDELLDIFETEGDEHNGGGLFVVEDRAQGKAVRFEEASGAGLGGRKVRGPTGLGEIGSPVPAHSIPVGFGGPRTPFPGLGA